MTTAVTVDHGTLAGPQRGGGPDPASRRAGSAFGDVPAVCATTMPSWQSIIGERYTFPSLALIPRGVREPLLVGSFGGEIPVDEVVRRGRDLALVRAVASPSGNTGDQPVLAHDPADHLLRDTRPERGLDPPVPVPAPGIGERPRHAGAQPGVLADAEPRVVVVVAAGRDTAASMSATSANTSASAGRPASSSPGSTGAAGRRPGLFLRPPPPPASTRSPDSSSRIRRRSTSGSSPNGSLSVPACGMASLRSGLRRRHSTGAVQSHPMMHRTGADAKLRRHLLPLHTRQAQFHRATPRPQRYGRLGNGIRIPGIVAQPPYPDTVWSDTPDAPPPASWTSVWRNTTPPPVHAPRDRTRQQSFRSVSKKTSAAPNQCFEFS